MTPPAPPSVDVLALGNAIVDVLSHVDDAVIDGLPVNKGGMTLIGAVDAQDLYGTLGPGVECSGGSAANTVVGAAMLGVRTAFVGRVRDDQLGHVFTHDIRAAGVQFDTAPATDGPETAVCMVMVTPDAHRTMCTHLGASIELGPDDVDEALVRNSAVLYLEGYLWDPPGAREAMRRAIRIAKDEGRAVALSLSDPFAVDRHRADFLDLVDNDVDILFANEHELTSLYGIDDLDTAFNEVMPLVKVAACTRGEHGAVIVGDGETHVIPAEPAVQVVDTTGAGDLFAAGFLAGWTQGRNLHDCGRMGAVAAAEVISHLGARPEADLRALVTAKVPA
ncbi:MAG: adenosine kinase [Miltoncostaeaceae bacterium]